MAIKAILKSLDGLSEEVASMYRKEGDNFVLDLSTNDLKEHPSNTGLIKALEVEREERKKLEDTVEKYKDIDPEKAREAMKSLQELEEKKMIDEGEIDKLLEAKTQRMREDFENQLAAKNKTIEELNGSVESITSELSDIKIYDTVKDAALKAGARPEAITDIKNRASSTWKLVDGQPRAFDGDNQAFGKNGEPLSIEEWVGGLVENAPYLFAANQGGGSSGGDQHGRQNTGIKMLSAEAAGDNLEAIASGEAVVNRN